MICLRQRWRQRGRHDWSSRTIPRLAATAEIESTSRVGRIRMKTLMTEPFAHTIVNVDDDDAGRYTKSRILRRAGYRVLEASTGADGLGLVAEVKPQLLLLESELAGYERAGGLPHA